MTSEATGFRPLRVRNAPCLAAVLSRRLDLRRLDLPLAGARIHPDRVEAPVGWGGEGDVVGAIRPARELRVSPGRRGEPRGRGGEGRSAVDRRGEVQIPGVFAR